MNPFLESKRNKPSTLLLIVVLATTFGAYKFLGVYSTPPTEAVPVERMARPGEEQPIAVPAKAGSSVLVRRASGEPWFNSAEGNCKRRVGVHDKPCRPNATDRAPEGRVIMSLTFMEWAYRESL
ncbi:hypothetical protein [Montanilutibacter psychrotolerans]|uniref:Uncharacterized protein n=1 Tax=Montanilutibacter psychrotolerans TaxID=1327343 RepID=A0A3M8SPB0_9GAMM|nr:hypothetical protein [Lysobacter psychrotolerans]RNF82613.1 hypothetical protein EER27_14005 [Lysobacter psychrotolerans]